MSKVSYENIVNVLLEKFPEFKESKEFFGIFDEEDMKLPYIIWGSFCQYAVKRFNENGPDDSVVTRLFAFVNEQFANPDSEHKVLELLTVEVFENFAQEERSLAYAREHTKDKARQSLEESMWWTGVGSPDASISPEAAVERQKIMFANKYSKEDSYAKKVLGIRNYKSDKKEFGVHDLCDVEVLEDFLYEVSTGESDITPAGKAFLEEYYGLQNLAQLLHKKGTSRNLSNDTDSAEGIYNWLKKVEPMETRRFIEETRGNIKPGAKLKTELLPPGTTTAAAFLKKPVFLASVAAGALLIAFEAYQWDLIEIVTPFLIIFIQGPIAAAFFASAIWSLVYAFRGWKEIKAWALLPLAINVTTLLILANVPFTELTIQRDFKINLLARQHVIQDIRSGTLKNNVDYNRTLIHLPITYGNLSKGGNDILYEENNGSLSVFFFTYRGVVDNYAGIIYKESNEPPNAEDFNCGTVLETSKFTDNWYWMSCT